MDGTETKDELDRCRIWDAIFTDGAMDSGSIAEATGLHGARVANLIDHEWFTKMHGLYYITTVDGVRRKGLMVATS